MPLTLETIQPINLDGVKCFLKVDPENRLRLSQIKKVETNDDKKRAAEIISACFPDNSEYVAEKVLNLSSVDISVLVVYLMDGKSGVDVMMRQIDRETDRLVEARNNG